MKPSNVETRPRGLFSAAMAIPLFLGACTDGGGGVIVRENEATETREQLSGDFQASSTGEVRVLVDFGGDDLTAEAGGDSALAVSTVVIGLAEVAVDVADDCASAANFARYAVRVQRPVFPLAPEGNLFPRIALPVSSRVCRASVRFAGGYDLPSFSVSATLDGKLVLVESRLRAAVTQEVAATVVESNGVNLRLQLPWRRWLDALDLEAVAAVTAGVVGVNREDHPQLLDPIEETMLATTALEVIP